MQAATTLGTKTVVIVGGGVSGALTAFHLRRGSKDVRVVIVDPRQELGLGLAYSTPSLRHLLNVPAGKISAVPDEPGHFVEWLRCNHDPSATEHTFAPRAIFGRYIRTIFKQVLNVQHLQTSVIDLAVSPASADLTLEDGKRLHADFVVLATGNFEPAMLPGIDPDAIASNAYCHNAWEDSTYADVPENAPVTLIGTGLTGVDVALRLRELGHRGVITAVSRHGMFPNRHEDYIPIDHSVIFPSTQATCIDYLRALRSAIASGIGWRAVIDSLRAKTNELWLALPLKEKKRFRRHLQRRWDVVRHRMAPPVADLIEAELAAGTLRIEEGRLVAIEAQGDGALVKFESLQGQNELATARVINCTGPDMNYRRVKSPLLNSLFARGIATPGPLGGGFNSSLSGALIDLQGRTSEVLFNLGPGRLGTLLESIAVPEIRSQAVAMATLLVNRSQSANGSRPVGEAVECNKEVMVSA